MNLLNQKLVLLSFLIVLAFSSISSASYSREEAYSYLVNEILGNPTDGLEYWGSQSVITAGYEITYGNTSLPALLYNSWIFTVDENFHALRPHSMELYAINEDNLSQWSTYLLSDGPFDIELEFISRGIRLGKNEMMVGNQPGNIVEALPTDPHLKALIIVAGTKQAGEWGFGRAEKLFYNDAQRWYVMLKAQGFAEENIKTYLTDGDDVEAELYWYPPPGNRRPEMSNSDPDLDRDGDPDVTGPADWESIEDAFIELIEDCDPKDRIVIYISGHGPNEDPHGNPDKVYVKLWPNEECKTSFVQRNYTII